MAAFQLWRGAVVDGLLFSGLVVMLVVDRLTGGRIVLIRRAAQAPRWVVLTTAASLGLVLAISPRHGTLDAIAITALGVLALVLAWSPTGKRPERPAAAYRRSAITWSLLGVVFCLWEAGAYIASVSGGGDSFPTVSVLLEPFLEWPLGRLLFTAAWLIGGLSLLRVWHRR
jgi:hypothetical protein